MQKSSNKLLQRLKLKKKLLKKSLMLQWLELKLVRKPQENFTLKPRYKMKQPQLIKLIN
jgi:hypothetical protein